MNKRSFILALVATAVAAVMAAKHMRQEAVAPPTTYEERTAGPALYLFLNDRDHDADCERVYGAFEAAKAGLPAGFEAKRVDVERESTLAEKLGVRMLPTILLIDRNGAVTDRVEGEGEEAESKVRELVSRISRGK